MGSAKKTNQQTKAAKQQPIVVAQIIGKWVGGGVEAVIMNYYRHIDRTKVQFDFICDEDSTNIPYEEIEKLGGHVILCPPYQKLRKYMKFLENLFREKKYRIVHSNINTLSVFPLKAAKKAGVTVRIAHSHSTSNPKEWKKNLLKNVLRPFSKKYATDYFACSEHAGKYLFGNKTFNAGKVTIIPNAIDVNKFKFDPIARKKLRKEIGIKDDDFIIGHVGRFVAQKNHTFLVDVFSEVKKQRKNAKLVLVGQGPLREEIENKVKKLGLEKDVFFLGQRSDTNKLYSVFDVFCLPSLYEGLPVVGVEAQANGVPCVFSNNITEEVLCSNKTAERIGLTMDGWIMGMKRAKSRKMAYVYDLKKKAKELSEWYAKNTSIKISVVIPVFNCEKTILKTLDSIVNQEYDNYEVIIVNDGSIDDTEEILKNYSKCHNNSPIVVINTSNKGVSHARNVALKKTSGDVVLFLDGDDILLEGYFDSINRNMKDNDILIYGYICMSGDKKYIKSSKKKTFYDVLDLYEYLDGRDLANPVANKVYRSKIINKNKFNEKLNIGEDLDYFVQALEKASKTYCTGEQYYLYVISDSGLGFSRRKTIIKDKILMYKNLKRLYEKNRPNSKTVNNKLAKAFIQEYMLRNADSNSCDDISILIKKHNLEDDMKVDMKYGIVLRMLSSKSKTVKKSICRFLVFVDERNKALRYGIRTKSGAKHEN